MKTTLNLIENLNVKIFFSLTGILIIFMGYGHPHYFSFWEYLYVICTAQFIYDWGYIKGKQKHD